MFGLQLGDEITALQKLTEFLWTIDRLITKEQLKTFGLEPIQLILLYIDSNKAPKGTSALARLSLAGLGTVVFPLETGYYQSSANQSLAR